MRNKLLALLLLFSLAASAQQKVFTEEAFVEVMKQYHPLLRQAALDVQIARANVTSAQGKFDPRLEINQGRKDFDGVTYYNEQENILKVPTWYGVDLYAGTETMRGDKLNNERTKGSISFVGVSVPVVQNLVIDKRRAALQQARIFTQQSEQERRAAVNDLVREGLIAYWNWWEAYNSYQLVQTVLQNAETRMRMVRTTVQLGDRAAIDTLEALTQIQSFQVRSSELLAQLVKTSLELSTYLWKDGDEAYQLPEDAVPQVWNNTQQLSADSLLVQGNTHPELLQYNFKLNALAIERRLKFQSLLPEVNLKYQQLGKGTDFAKTINGTWFNNNYRFGVSLAVPLRLSEGRGEYTKAKLKLEQTRLQQANKQVQVRTKIRQYFTEWQQTTNQISVQQQNAANYLALQRGEEVKFQNGESSLFLINARELKTLEAQQKILELQAKNRKALASVKWAAGTL